MKITTKTGDKGETSLFGGRRVSKASDFIELVGELDELQAVVGWGGVAAGREECREHSVHSEVCHGNGMKDQRKSGDGDEGSTGDLQINRLDFRDLPTGQAGLPTGPCLPAGRQAGIPELADSKVSPVILLNRVVDDLYRMMSIVGFEMKCPANIKPIGEEDVEFLEVEMSKYEEAVGDLNKFVRPGGSSELAARLHIARTVCRRVERRMVGFRDVPKITDVESFGFMLKYLNRLSDLLFVMAYSSQNLNC